jgi:hypothetical protein
MCSYVNREVAFGKPIHSSNMRAPEESVMPQVTIEAGFIALDGHEERLTEYLCDWPDCPNIATHVLGCVREIGIRVAVCEEHAAMRSA